MLLFILSSYFVALQALHFQQLQPKIVNVLSVLQVSQTHPPSQAYAYELFSGGNASRHNLQGGAIHLWHKYFSMILPLLNFSGAGGHYGSAVRIRRAPLGATGRVKAHKYGLVGFGCFSGGLPLFRGTLQIRFLSIFFPRHCGAISWQKTWFYRYPRGFQPSTSQAQGRHKPDTVLGRSGLTNRSTQKRPKNSDPSRD